MGYRKRQVVLIGTSLLYRPINFSMQGTKSHRKTSKKIENRLIVLKTLMEEIEQVVFEKANLIIQKHPHELQLKAFLVDQCFDARKKVLKNNFVMREKPS